MASGIDRLWRLIRLIGLMQSGQRYSARDMAEILEVSERTVYRDLQVLEAASVPFYCDGGYRLHSSFFMKAVQLEFDEALALHLAARAMGKGEDNPFLGPSRRALAKLEQSLPADVKGLLGVARAALDFDPQPLVDMSDHRRTFETLEDAVLRCRRVEITYHSMGRDEVGQRRLDPYGLFYRWRAWYAVGLCHRRHEVRMFRVDRIRELRMLPEVFTRPGDFSLEEYLDGTWRVERGPAQDIAIWFAPGWSRWICEVEWHPSQSLDARPDGSVVLRLRTGSVSEIKRWVLGFGPGARLLQPQALARELARDIRAMSDTYGDEAPLDGAIS